MTEQWVVYRWYNGVRAVQISRSTSSYYFLSGNGWIGSRRIDRSEALVIVPDRATAERLRDSIAGIDGEFKRRERASDEAHRERVAAARTARDDAVARLLERETVA